MKQRTPELEQENVCKEINSKKSDPSLTKLIETVSKSICERNDGDFVTKVLMCTYGNEKSQIDSRDHCMKPSYRKELTCSEFADYMDCVVKKTGSKCGGEEATKIVAITAVYGFATEPRALPSRFRVCMGEVVLKMQAIYA